AAIFVSVLATACSGEKPEQQVKSAKEYLQKQDNKSALIQLKNALQQNPALGEARFLMGTILLQDGDATGAEVEFRKALAAKHPENIVVPELAKSMLILGQAKKLTDQYAATRFNVPAADASLQTTLATAQSSLGKNDLAEESLAAALAADPSYVPALILRARQKAASRDVDGALSALEAILSKAPTSTEAWKLKGDLLLYGKNEADDALIAYRKSIEANPKFGPGHLAILAILMQQNKLEEASKQLDELKKFAAKNPETRYAEAQLAYQKKDFKTARDIAQELLRLSSKNPRILQLAGAIEFQTNSLAQAEIYLVAATRAEPKNVLSQRLLISTYLRSGQAAKALTALNSITGKDGLDPRYFSLAGEVHLQNGNAKIAEDYFSKALKADPGNVATRTSMALTHLATGQNDNGFDELETIAGSDAGTTADMALISAHLKRKDFDKALVAVEKLEVKHPDKPVAANLRGRIQLAQKNTAAARLSFEKALAIDPSYFAAAASLAALDMVDKKPTDAKKRFENLLAKNPKNGQALLALAELAALQGAGKDEVAVLLSKAVEANPTEVAPRLLLIELYLGTNDGKLAITTAQNAVGALPASMELLDALGRAQQASGDLKQAASTFAKLVAEQPLSPQAHMRVAAVQHANKNTQAAEQSVRKALEIKPDFLEAQRSLILLDLDAKKYQDAVALARVVQKQRPEADVGFSFEGDIYSAQKDWNAAAAAYRAGLKLSQSPELAIKLHAVTSQSEQKTEAERFATTWVKEHPKDVRFQSYLAEAALSRKDYAIAEKHYLAVVQVQPDSAAALNNLAWVSQLLHRDKAITYAEKANALVPNQPSFMDTWAMLLSEKGEHAKAIELQVKTVKAQPENTGFRLNLAKIYLAASDKSKARSELDVLTKLGDKDPSYKEASALIKTL
ncbi:MAG: PEP-CTERM system TPR-repeat protein PrsT, partial [Pseudomonadota bacterium]|nr:PEP-CTERM system TPR-repeat protein PrsT [Pseudomonadota bacterium]